MLLGLKKKEEEVDEFAIRDDDDEEEEEGFLEADEEDAGLQQTIGTDVMYAISSRSSASLFFPVLLCSLIF